MKLPLRFIFGGLSLLFLIALAVVLSRIYPSHALQSALNRLHRHESKRNGFHPVSNALTLEPQSTNNPIAKR